MTPQQNPTIPYGYCQCGCGEKTEIKKSNVRLFVGRHGKRGNRNKHSHGLKNRKPPIPVEVDGEPCFLIPLTQVQHAIIDECDLPLISGYCWQLNGGYASRNGRPGEKRTIKMHHVFLPLKDGLVVDHINGNRLDNRRLNLRYVTYSGNGINKPLQRNNTSGYVGVSKHNLSGKWTVRINVNQKAVYLGLFDELDQAVRVRNSAEEEHYRETRPRVPLRTAKK